MIPKSIIDAMPEKWIVFQGGINRDTTF